MDEKVKQVLVRIKEGNLNLNKRLGDTLSDLLFVNQAIFIDKEGCAYYLHSFGNDKTETNNSGLFLTEVLAVLQELEASHLLFVSKRDDVDEEMLFYSSKTKFNTNQFEGVYDIGNGLLLKKEDDTFVIVSNGSNILFGTALPDVLAKDVVRFFSSVVYPTNGLKRYIDRGFITKEQQRAKRANTISVIGIIIAILVAISAPFVTIWWSNTHGKSTIVETQYDRLLDSISVLRNQTKDTVIIERGRPKDDTESKNNNKKGFENAGK